ncbi:MAG: PEP-CTERM sorting domain-containing protein [Verrucomicrobiaceae bacterium]
MFKLTICALLFASSLNGQTWTDWNAPTGGNTQVTGTLIDGVDTITVTVFGCVAGTVSDGTSTAFSDVSFYSPALPTSDMLFSDHTEATDGQFVIHFSQAVTNPVFHMTDRHHTFGAFNALNNAPITLVPLSGNLKAYNDSTSQFTESSGTVIGRDDWYGPTFITGGNSNGFGNTTADGTFRMIGTFTAIDMNLYAEDFVGFQMGLVPVPEPTAPVLVALAGLVMTGRRKR